MSPKTFTYIYYPGHLGHCPITELTSERGILWNASVKRVPDPFADSLVRESGFQLALDMDDAAKALGFSKTKLRDLIQGGLIQSTTYQPPREGESKVPVVVVPSGLTTMAFRARLTAETETEKVETETSEKETPDA